MNSKVLKYNFIVSDYRKLWIDGATHLYILEPYVYYRLEKTGHISDYNAITVAPYRRQSSSDLEKDHNFVQLKFEKYINILANRLNHIHHTHYDKAFWRRALSISFERYITYLYEMFANCRLYFNQNEHDCQVLSEKSYYTPSNFDDQRNFFQHSHYGQEQIFSLYMHYFYPDGLKTVKGNYQINSEHRPEKPLLFRLLKQVFSGAFLARARRQMLTKFYSRHTHRIGIMGSSFSAKHMNHLMIKSKGSIYPIAWQIDIKSDDAFLWDNRKYLAKEGYDFDDFDRFFFASITRCFPKLFVENFKKTEQYYLNYFTKFKDLKFVTSEAWLSSDSLCIALALLKEQGVKHIYNEHNYFEHPWVGSLIPKETSLADIFVSMGWYSNKINNLYQGASLFDFNLNKKPDKRYKICYIGSGASAKRPSYSASYGWSCENAPKYFKFVKQFLGNLSYQTISEITYRGYPVSNYEDWLAYDQDYMLSPYIQHMLKHNDISTSGKLIMLQSNLVIVDYISTAYLESLIMNIPTIFFWNSDACYLSNDYADFFDSLISVGICQTDPIKAAHFVESVKENPQEWWDCERVQKAKGEFLRINIGEPQVMIDYLLGLLKSNNNSNANH